MRPADRVRRLLERPRLLLAAAVVLQWLTALAVGLRANDVDLGTRGLVDVLVLGPLALLLVARIAGRIGGPALTAWTLLLWVALPWLAPAFTLASYDSTLRDDVLPLALGLTGDAGYAAGVATLLAVELATRRGRNERLLGALAAWTLLLWVALPWLAPAFTLASYDATLRDDVLPLALGLTGDAGYAAGVATLLAVELATRRGRNERLLGALALAVLGATLLVRGGSGSLSLDALQASMTGLREYFWSQRLLQWLPLAGVVAVARRSLPLALLLGGWLGSVLVLRVARTGVGFEGGELFRALLPGLPALVLLAAALPLLVPTLATRLGPLARPAEVP